MKTKLRDTAVTIDLFKKDMSKYVNPFSKGGRESGIPSKPTLQLTQPKELKKKITLRKNVFDHPRTQERPGHS